MNIRAIGKLVLIVAASGLLMVSTLVVQAKERVALIIGNSAYQNAGSLANPKNDADDMAQMLQTIGFEVTKLKDLGYDDMRRALRNFSSDASQADVALVFYAGHGMEVNKHNYLIPTDAALVSDRDIDFEAVPLDLVTQATSGARKLSLVLLDACRNNPFAAQMKRTIATRSIGRGLAQVEPTRGTLVSFAAKEGTIANDGRGRNSPYTTALIQHLQQPGLEVQFLFRKVRDSVLEKTNGGQEPFMYGSLPGEQIFLIPPSNQVVTTKKDDPGDARDSASDDERVFWTSVRDSGDSRSVQLYLEKYPKGVFAALAQLKIAALGESKGKRSDQVEENTRIADLKPDVTIRKDPNRDDTQCDKLAAHSSDPDNKTGFSVDFDELESDPEAAISACKRAIVKYPDDPQVFYQLARAFDAARDFTNAVRYYEEASDRGSSHSMNNLGVMYRDGEGVDQNYTRAAHFFKRAAEKGNSQAMTSLGFLFEKGNGVRYDEREAVRYYKMGADAGNAQSQNNLAVMYREGRGGLSQDHREAARLFELAVEGGNSLAMTSLGFQYEQGNGVKKSTSEAIRLYRLAADEGEQWALNNLGVMYREGTGVKRDYAKSIEYFEQSAEKGNSNAMTSLGYYYETGTGTKRNDKEAVRYYRLAVEAGNGQAMHNLGNMYYTGAGVGQSYRKSAEHIYDAIKQNTEFSVNRMTQNHSGLTKKFKIEMQRFMKNDGFYDGPLDGSFGPATRRAILQAAGR